MAGIDRIGAYTPNDNGTVTRRVQDADASRDDSGFRLLSEEAGGVIYEPGQERTEPPKTMAQIREETAREEAAAARANLHARFDGPGVAVELSTDGVEASEKPAQQSIVSIFRDAWRAIVDFFVGIWNGGDAQTGTVAGTGSEAGETESISTEASAAAADTVSPAPAGTAADTSGAAQTGTLRGNSAEDIAAFMADYGGRHLAKNSDLLTQYDRTGHIVDVDPTDRRRILQGEGRVRRF